MPIPVQTIVTLGASALDAEGSDRYIFDEDYRPGIHYGINMATRVLDILFAEKKYSPEALVELTRTRVWQTDAYSRFTFNPADLSGEEMWTLFTVHPKAKCKPQGPILILADDVSKVRTDLLYIGSDESAARMTYEQSALDNNNPYSPGNPYITNKLKMYSVLDASNYTSTPYNTPGTYAYEVRPAVPKELIGVRYLIRPTLPNLITDSIQFRPQATQLIVDFMLQWISWKQGDGTTLYSVSERDKQQVFQTFTS